VYAFREDAPHHARSRRCIDEVLASGDPCVPNIVALSFVRIVTNQRIFASAAPVATALSFIEALRSHSSRSPEIGDENTWEVFERLASSVGRGGNAIPDVYVAAITIHHDATLHTFDRDFERFDGLRVQVLA
jgi:uncharacterized protein